MKLANIRTKTIVLGGGLDLESPRIAIKEGYALEANNIEPNLMGGYRKMLGYERVDGRVPPSQAVYYSLAVDASTEIAGATITGSISGATAVITSVDATLNLLGITKLVGNFQVGDILNTATVTAAEALSGHPVISTSIQWQFDAENYYRSFIGVVPGVGNILGAWQYNGIKYAFRSNGANVVMHKSSSAGWVAVPMFRLLHFDTGVMALGEIIAGDTITGLVSTATAIVKNFIVTSGNYSVDAVGYMVVDVTSGTFQNLEAIQKGGVTKMNAVGVDTAIVINGGTHDYRFITYNFYGNSDARMMYGCDGVNNAFQFDGTVYTPIITGMAVDKPTAIEAHKNHLFLSFVGGSLQHSSIGVPLVFNVILGAGELAVGDDIRGLKSTGGDALLISTDRAVSVLYGSSTLDWIIKLLAVDTGDVGNTLEVIGTPLITTSRGIVRMDANQKFGNFESSTLSRRINPLLYSALKNKTVIGTNVIRNKNQYRIYFNDGSGIILTHDQLYGSQSLPQFSTFEYPHNPTCVSSVPVDSGEEVILFGSDNGFVYQEEKGYNFDGAVSNYSLRLPFHHLGSPSLRKAFKWLDAEIDTTRSTTLRLTYEFSDGQSFTSSSRVTEYNITIGDIAKWNQVNWGEFNWGDTSISSPITSLNGAGYNISLFFFGSSATDSDFTLSSITYQYILRRYNRG